MEVTLYYAQNAPEPVNSTVTFHHKDAATDQELTSTQQELAPNTYASADYKTEIEGYTYASAAQETFTVDGTGAPVDVTLYYNQNAPTEPVVLEEYTNQYGITTKGQPEPALQPDHRGQQPGGSGREEGCHHAHHSACAGL